MVEGRLGFEEGEGAGEVLRGERCLSFEFPRDSDGAFLISPKLLSLDSFLRFD